MPAQLRTLDPSDTHLAGYDLIALYTRQTTYDIEIRLDLLDLQLDKQGDITLVLDWLPDGSELPALESNSRAWDVLIEIPAEGLTAARSLNPFLAGGHLPHPRVVRNPQLDAIVVRLNAQLLPAFQGNFHAAAFSALHGRQKPIDIIGPVSSETQFTGRAPLLLAFWNAMPAQTPAQALRRWDGAHTGPLGQRHGLHHLLNAAQRSSIPIVLLDAQTPLSLSALDIVGGMPQITSMQAQRLLSLSETLPEPFFGDLPDWAIQYVLQKNRSVAAAFGLHGSEFIYTPTQQPYSTNTPQEIDSDGLNIALRRRLLAAALSPNTPPSIMVLGGDLPHSNWGDALFAGPAMAYIAAHPWMHALRAAELSALPRLRQPSTPEQTHLLEQLRRAPESTSTRLAWDAFLALLAPASPQHPDLPALRARYLGEIGNLLAAVAWERGELPIHDDEIFTNCSQDTDFDAQAECQLATETYFAIIDPDGARLSVLLARQANGTVVQIVAPSSQFAVGLSDPMGWDLTAGVLADPAVIPGAFAGPWETFDIAVLPNGVQLSGAALRKKFRLNENGLAVEYRINSPLETLIPLGVSAETRFEPGWAGRYGGEDQPQGWVWGIRDGAQGLIQTSGTLTHQTFGDDLPALLLPENPNYDYPPGHYLPFPIAVATIRAEGNFWVQIGLRP